MKNTALKTTIHLIGISSFLFFVSLGITAQATMIGMTILVAWAVASMLAIELRRPVLEAVASRAARHTALVSAGQIVSLPVSVRPAA